MDHYIINFFKDNMITIWLFVNVMKGIAILHPGVKTDKISELLNLVYDGLRSGGVPKKV
jgi:hypothetical protein